MAVNREAHGEDHIMDYAAGSVSVVIPVYNSAECLPELVERLEKILISFPEKKYELILVNDGSRDHSWQVMCGLAERYSWIRTLDLMRNYGQHNALLAGIRQSRFEIIVTMDDDLQNPPEEIPKLLAGLKENVDVVYGKTRRPRHGLWRRLTSVVTKLALQGAMGAETARNVSAFRAFRTQLRDAFSTFQGSFVSIDVLLTWGTTRFTTASVRHDPRRSGVSNYTVRKLATHAINMMIGFSIAPLRLATLTGFGFTLFGLGILAYVLSRYLILGHSVPGFPFLASIIAIFSGAQLFTLGIIGEYLARIHARSINRPGYVVREKSSHDDR